MKRLHVAAWLLLASCAREVEVDPLEARPRAFELDAAPRIESGCTSEGVDSTEPQTVTCIRVDRSATERVWPAREGWRLRGLRFAHRDGGLLTLRFSEIRGARDEFLVFQREFTAAWTDVVVAIRQVDVAGAHRTLLEVDRVVDRRVETLARAWVPTRVAPSHIDAYPPGWELRETQHEFYLVGTNTLTASPVCAWSWSDARSERFASLAVESRDWTVSEETTSLPAELRASLASWPEPVWELRADVRKLGTLEALGETESGRTHFTTPASWSRVPASDLWLKGDGSVHLVTLDAATTEQLLPASEGWSQIGLEFTRATRGSVKARLTLFGRGGGTEFEQGQELDGGSRCLVLAFRFLPVGAARPESGEYRWLRIERDHANLLSSGALPSRWIPSTLGPFAAGWNTTAGTTADPEHGVNVLATWSWNGAGSADLAARRLAFEHPTDIELEHPELQESDVPNWPEPVFLLRAETFP
ncbi:MAG: hypothetical protein U1F29_00260 [Planctomycetota bacterium]